MPTRDKLTGSLQDKGQGIVLDTGQKGYFQNGDLPNISDGVEFWAVNFSGSIHAIFPPHYFFQAIYDRQTRFTDEFLSSMPVTGGSLNTSSGEQKSGHGYSESDSNLALFSLSNTKQTKQASYWIHSFADKSDKEVIGSQDKIGCKGNPISWSSTTKEILFIFRTAGDSIDSSGYTDRIACIYNYDTRKIVYQISLYQYPDAAVSDNLILGKLIINSGKGAFLVDYKAKQLISLPVTAGKFQVINNRDTGSPTNYLMNDSSDDKNLKYQFYDIKNNRQLPTISFPRHTGIDVGNPRGSDSVEVQGVSPESKMLILSYNLRNESPSNVQYRCWYSLEIDMGKLNKIVCDDFLLKALGKNYVPSSNNYFTVYFAGWL